MDAATLSAQACDSNTSGSPDEPAATAPLPDHRIGTPSLPIRILIADDEEDLRKSITLRLRKHRMEVSEAGCGRDAIAACVSVPPNVLLLDLRMPDMEGFRVLEILRSLSWLEPMPVIMLTSAHHATKVRKAVESGVSDFIAKPFPWPLLIERVEHRSKSWEPVSGIPLTWTNGRNGVIWVEGPVPRLDRAAAIRLVELIRALLPLRDEQVQVSLAGCSLTEGGLDQFLQDAPESGSWTFVGCESACGERTAVARLAEIVPPGSGVRLSVKTYIHGRVGVLEVHGSCFDKEQVICEKVRALSITRSLLLVDCSYAVFPRRFLDTLTDLTKELWNKKVALNFVIPGDEIRRDLDGRLGEWALVYPELGEALEELQ